MRRTAVGIFALIFLGIAGYGFYVYGANDDETAFLWASCFRMGLVLGCFWFALPKLLEQKGTISPTALILAGTLLLVVAVRPRAILLLWPVVVILVVIQFFHWLVKPPPRKRKKSQ